MASEHIDSSPSPEFCKRLAAEKRVNVYYVPGTDDQGHDTYAYVVVSSVLHDQFMEQLHQGKMPDFAVVAHSGYGKPTAEIKAKMKKYYGFDHDLLATNDNYDSGADSKAG